MTNEKMALANRILNMDMSKPWPKDSSIPPASGTINPEPICWINDSGMLVPVYRLITGQVVVLDCAAPQGGKL